MTAPRKPGFVPSRGILFCASLGDNALMANLLAIAFLTLLFAVVLSGLAALLVFGGEAAWIGCAIGVIAGMAHVIIRLRRRQSANQL